MNIINLQINKIIIHQIYQRDPDGNKISPKQSFDFINFDADAMLTFKSRVIDALGAESKAVEMTIINQEQTDTPYIVNQLSETEISDEYVQLSYNLANKLADAQTKRNIPGGIVVVFSGTYGATPKKFVGIMKAEIYSAYQKLTNENSNEITLEYIEEALLTPATKLYKTAGFFEKGELDTDGDLNCKWDAVVCDTQISQTDGKAAARYFYANFLGFGYPESSAKTTKEFYDATCEFIQELDVTEEERYDIRNSLNSYLRENSDSISPVEFAGRHFEESIRDSFTNFLEDKDLPTSTFAKDIKHIESNLKTRKLSFSKHVKVSAPSQVFQELVEIETISEDSNGNPVNWTNILVKDNIVSQE